MAAARANHRFPRLQVTVHGAIPPRIRTSPYPPCILSRTTERAGVSYTEMENKVTLQSAHSDKRGKPGGFLGTFIRDKIVTDRQQFAGSQDFASGEHFWIEIEKCSPPISYGTWLPAFAIDTFCQVVIILTVGKTGNSLPFQPLAPEGDWRKIESVKKRRIKDDLGSRPPFGKRAPRTRHNKWSVLRGPWSENSAN